MRNVVLVRDQGKIASATEAHRASELLAGAEFVLVRWSASAARVPPCWPPVVRLRAARFEFQRPSKLARNSEAP